MTEMYDVLETCLAELENGARIESLLAQYPAYANDLRPILTAAVAARQMSAPEPAHEAVVRGRARLMQQVSELREQKIAPRKRVIPFFQRMALSFSVAAVFLLSGTGLVGASSTALPGQNLYPIKRNWESVRLFFTFDPNARVALEDEFKLEREHETSELLSEKEQHEVEFSGTLSTLNDVKYIANIQVVFPADAQIPQDGVTLEVKGKTTAQGYVEITEFEISQESESPSGEDSNTTGTNQDSNEHNGEVNPAPSIETPEQEHPGNEISTPEPGKDGSQLEDHSGEITPTPMTSSDSSGSSSGTDGGGSDDKSGSGSGSGSDDGGSSGGETDDSGSGSNSGSGGG